MKKAFTLVELIFVIVIIGVLAAVAVPKFTKLSDNAKISSELSTASSVQTAIEACHGEWIISDCAFTCGKDIDSSTFSAEGYPTDLGANLERILKIPSPDWTSTGTIYKGPASGTKGTTHCKADKPCIGKSWSYDSTTGEFKLI